MSDSVVLACRLILVGVFAVAAFAKLADVRGTRQSLAGFRVPDRLSHPAVVLLPLAELAVAVALVPRASAQTGAVGALALLVLFAAAIGWAMFRGRQPDCHCFGQLHSAPAGGRALARNLALAVLAAVVAVAGSGPSVGGWAGSLHGSRLVLTIGVLVGLIVVAQAAVILTLLKRYGRTLLLVEQLKASGMAEEDEGLAVGELAPEFELSDLDGQQITLRDLREPDLPLLLIFSDPECGPCESLLPQLASWQVEHADRLVTALISRGDASANAHMREQHGIDRVALQEGQEVDRLYRVAGTPSAVLVDVDGRVASPPAPGGERIAQLVENSVGSETRQPRRDAEPADIPLAVLLADRPAPAHPQWPELANTGGSQ